MTSGRPGTNRSRLRFLNMLGVLLLAAAVASGTGSAVCDAVSGLSAEQMFERTRDAWTAVQYPDDVYYVVVVSGKKAEVLQRTRYRGHAAPKTGVIAVHRFTDDEASHPYTPRGVNVAVTIVLNNRNAFYKSLTSEPPSDLIGIPELSPLYTFGIRRTAVHPSSAASIAPNDNRLKTIGGTATRERDYDVACGGLETADDGGSLMRLTLQPRRDPGRLRVRTLWVDPQSFTVVKTETQGNFLRGAPMTVRWLTTFVTRNGVPMIANERAEVPLQTPDGLLRDITIEFIPDDAPPDNASRLLFNLLRDERDLREPDDGGPSKQNKRDKP